MRVLAVCDAPPATGVRHSDGNTLISHHLLTRLGASCQVRLAWFDRPGLQPSAEVLRACESATELPVDASPWMSATDAVSRYPGTARRRSAPAAVAVLQELARDVDVVYLHGPACLLLADRFRAPVVVNEVDPMSLALAEQAQRSNGVHRAAALVRARRASAAERRASRAGARLLLVNPADAKDLSRVLGSEVSAIPNGVQRRTAGPHLVRDPRQVSFVGAFDYPSNVQSATLLARDVLPLVRRHVPDAHVVLAGRAATEQVRALASDGVQVLEDVPDVMAVLGTSAVAAFPGGFGRGTRNSVLQALRSGTPVVASAVSARGVQRGEHMSAVDTVESAASAVVHLLDDPTLRARMTIAATRFGAGLPDWDAAIEVYVRLLEECAQDGPRLRILPIA